MTKLSSNHPSSAVSTTENQKFKFSACGLYCAVHSPSVDGSSLRVYSVTTGRVINEHKIKCNVTSFGYVQDKFTFKIDERKDKKDVYLVVGLEDGRILGCSIVEHGKQLFELVGHTGSVTALCSWGRNEMYSTDKWSLKEKKIVRTISNLEGNYLSAICVSNESVAVATHIAYVLDKKSLKIQHELKGQDKKITNLSLFKNLVLASSEESRFMYCWNLTNKEEKNFSINEEIKASQMINSFFVGLSSSGSVHVYEKMKEKATVSIISENDKEKIKIHAVTLLFGEDDVFIEIVRGNHLKPVFERLNISGMKGSINLSRFVAQGVLLNAKGKEVKNVNKKAAVSGPADFAMEGSKVENEQVGDLINLPKTESTSKVPKADSMTRMLVQALHTTDHQLLEQVLQVGDSVLIENTIKKLPTHFVIPFLEQVVKRFEDKHTRGLVLLSWIKCLITIHLSYLVSVKGLKNKIKSLYKAIDTRLSIFQDVLQLAGRLDLVVHQITKKSNANENNVDNAQVTYNEDDESDDEETVFRAMQVDPELDNQTDSESDNDSENNQVDQEEEDDDEVYAENMDEFASFDSEFEASDDEDDE
ncbi:hypothetical protein O9G_001307 [Rozella allomycis CSF55]|uniref:Small-subunit processome Utp12 domain-containing protein n=1 Tax=Rozella allomycis (strain CSF55) TaxID=988480 RepID=A0A075AQG6_ROZAC|nr:hypothetical protein O9G_001307 [Rozella allomycis CSF55]|eukprot:EPZ32405.1 hypothetical protein O9G_001307 [Rozella allomycis CSF55]